MLRAWSGSGLVGASGLVWFGSGRCFGPGLVRVWSVLRAWSVSGLVGASGLVSGCPRVVSLDKKYCFTLSFFTQVYKKVPFIHLGMLGGRGGGGGKRAILQWTSIPSRGSNNTLSRLMLRQL